MIIYIIIIEIRCETFEFIGNFYIMLNKLWGEFALLGAVSDYVAF